MNLKHRRYKVVDVFSSQPLSGNPVAVVPDAEDLDTETMQAIARWTNLSETTFLLAPTTPKADYRLRIFTPRSELPFAGHPTLGSAYAALEAGQVIPGDGQLVQECGVGLVDITIHGTGTGQRLTFELPNALFKPLMPDDVTELETVLGQAVVRESAPAIVNVGAVWIVAQMPSAESLLRLRPDFAQCAVLARRLDVTGITVFANYKNGESAIEVRSFAPSCGVDEDPVCGSGNGSVAVFLRESGLIPAAGANYTAAQGQCVGRNGRIAVQIDSEGRVSIGGVCVTGIDGTLYC